MSSILGTGPDGAAIKINTDRLIETRLLITAQSGGGKSHTLRRILEQTFGNIQHIVIDPENEFYTLREKYDYILAGRGGGDCPADTRSAALLAHKLLELGTSAIIGIYELKYHDRIRFVKLFLDALVEAPKNLWHPVLVVVDEAQIFCPQVGEAESASSVIDLMTRGRKRGFCGVLATQRLSKLHKDAAAEAGNVLIGKCMLDVDVKRAADSLGFSATKHQEIRSLRPGQFYTYGPALSYEVALCQVGAVQTSHPKIGKEVASPAAAPAAVKRILAQLADLPAEAEKIVRTEAELKAEIRRLTTELQKAQAASAKPSEADLEKATQAGRLAATKEFASELEAFSSRVQNLNGAYQESLKNALKDIKADGEKLIKLAKPYVSQNVIRTLPLRVTVQPVRPDNPGDTRVGQSQRKILTALAQFPQGRTISQLALLSGYTVNGHFNNMLGGLRADGFISPARVHPITITEAGLEALGSYEPLPTGEELRKYWLNYVGASEARILNVLIEHWPDGVAVPILAEKAGYTVNGHFNNMLGHLRKLELISPARTTPRASDHLFEE